MKYSLLFDNSDSIAFKEWHSAVLHLYNKIAEYRNDVIEVSDNNKVVLVWVRGKGLISKK
jgi:hypothetical protein